MFRSVIFLVAMKWISWNDGVRFQLVSEQCLEFVFGECIPVVMVRAFSSPCLQIQEKVCHGHGSGFDTGYQVLGLINLFETLAKH